MNRFIKITVSAVVLAVLAGGNIFANPRHMGRRYKDCDSRFEKDFANSPKTIKKNYNGILSDEVEDKVIIGTVKSIDKNTGRVTLINSDGKTTYVIVNPSTVVFMDERRGKRISDVKIDQCVRVSLFRTITGLYIASRILIN